MVFEVSGAVADAEFAAYTLGASGAGLVKPVFARDVVAYILVGDETREGELEIGVARMAVSEVEGAEPRLEFIVLAAVEVDLELLDVTHGAETRLPVGRLEFIVVQGYVPEEVDGELVGSLEGHVGLVIEVEGVVFAARFERGKQRVVFLETHAVELREFAGIGAEAQGTAHKRGRYGALEGLGFAIGDVESRRHFIAVSSRETAGGEAHGPYHVGIDDGKPLLLAGTH